MNETEHLLTIFSEEASEVAPELDQDPQWDDLDDPCAPPCEDCGGTGSDDDGGSVCDSCDGEGYRWWL